MITPRSFSRSALALAGLLVTMLSCTMPRPAHAAPPAALEERLTPDDRAKIVERIAQLLEERYVDSTRAVQLGRHLRSRLATGAYDRESSASVFAVTLMRDMESVVKDLHLRVSYEPTREFVGGGPPPGAGGFRRLETPGSRPPADPPSGSGSSGERRVIRTSRIDGRDSVAIARTNFGFERVERLPGNIGYLKLDRFVPLDYSLPTVTAAMAFLAQVDAMIIDLRDNIGGSPDLVEHLASYFFSPEPVKLMEARNRALGVTHETRTLKEIPGRRLPGIDLVVLTSPTTASSAETFAYAIQQVRRGIVAGARTAGAGQGGAKTSVGAGLALFLPEWKVTMGPGWEGTGVAPDLAVPVREAKEIVHRRLLEQRLARETDPDRRRALELALELATAGANPALTGIDARRYAGQYGPRKIWEEGGELYMSVTGFRSRLVPVAPDVFRAGSDLRLRFNADSSGRVDSVTVEPLGGAAPATTEPRSS